MISPIIVGILCLLMLYVLSGINKIVSFEKTATLLASRDIFNMLPLWVSKLSLMGAIVLLTLGSAVLSYIVIKKEKGEKMRLLAKYIIVAFILFTILATYLFHNPVKDSSQKISFMKNTSIIGGFLILLQNYY